MKRISVSDETWRKLCDMKTENKCESFDELIRRLIEPWITKKPKEKLKWEHFKREYDIT